MPTISRTGTIVVTATTAPLIIAPFETESVELGSQILPFCFRQLRLIDAFNSGP
jgi:hypothetical protein